MNASCPSIFDLCVPRDDVRRGVLTEGDFAADLAQVINGSATKEYRDAATFFANTYPTAGLRALLRNVCTRLSGRGGESSSIFRLDTQYGGGKTHALIALVHAARGLDGVPNAGEFISAELLPRTGVRVGAFDGENADPMNGRRLDSDLLAHTPWGELAFALGGRAGFERIRRSDEAGVAPGAETIRELFGGGPALILLDELSVYLRKIRNVSGAREQLTAFLTGLFKAVESSPGAALVFTLAVGKSGKATDAYADENVFVAEWLAEAESVAARKATLIDPTAEDETAQVLRRRLFSTIDEPRAADVVEAYRALWSAHRDALPTPRVGSDWSGDFARSYPFHPALLAALTDKLATLGNFQRVRGMLRLLARTVGALWESRPTDTTAIHLHHVDPGREAIRAEILTRLGLPKFEPAIRNDVATMDAAKPALGAELDARHYAGLPPYGTYVARTVLLHTLAFNENLKGCTPEELRFALLSPALDPSFIDDARKRFVTTSAYLDDRPHVPLRFLTEANLTQIIRRQEQQVDPGEARAQLNDRIRTLFDGTTLNAVPFAAGPHDVPDDLGDGRPLLCLIGYDAESVDGDVVTIPALVERIFRFKGSAGTDFRRHLNNACFLVADARLKDEMRKQVVRRLALADLLRPERIGELAEHQQDTVREQHRKSDQKIALAIQQCYRHLFFPSKQKLDGAPVDLAHVAIEVQSASERPGDGQRQVVRALVDNKKLRQSEDQPDAPTWVRDRTPLKRGEITTAALRSEFRRDPALPMLVGDQVFYKGIRLGIDQGEYVYKSGALLWGKGDPAAEIQIDEQSLVYTAKFAADHGIWPRPVVVPPPRVPPEETTRKPDGSGHKAPDGGSTQKPKTQPEPPRHDTLSAEGPLREALTRLWEQARSRRIPALGLVTLRLFDAADAFKLISAIGSVPNAEKHVLMQVSYKTTEGSEVELTFSGTPNDALPVRDFLEPQLRAAKDRDATLCFDLKFTAGLVLDGPEPDRLTERLTRFATGAAFVEASAEAT